MTFSEQRRAKREEPKPKYHADCNKLAYCTLRDASGLYGDNIVLREELQNKRLVEVVGKQRHRR